MIRIHTPPHLGISDCLASRMIRAIDAGHYRIDPQGPLRWTPNGIRADPPSAWTDETLDLAHGGSLLRWHEDPKSSRALQGRETGVIIRRMKADHLPDIRLGDGIRRWTDHSTIAPGLAPLERIIACEPAHLALARQALSCPSGDERAYGDIGVELKAVMASALLGSGAFETLRVDAPNNWADGTFVRTDADEAPLPIGAPPDPELVAMLTRCVDVHGNVSQNGSKITEVTIDDHVTWLDSDDVPDPVEIIRILDGMRMRHERNASEGRRP